jgi:putative tryptophan/tyrosine transport system substrate-binding protein
MDRRAFISTAALELLAVPLAALAQKSERVYRIGVLGAGTAAQYAHRIEVFRTALRELGWVNKRAIQFDERWADDHYERLPRLAAELVASKVDLIFVTGGTPAVEAAMKATREIPIVFSATGDPVAQQLVQSMAHPGGNATGLALMSSELYGKRLALLLEAMPGLKHVALLINGANSFSAEAVRASQSASRSLSIQLDTFDARDPEDLEKTFERLVRAGVQAVIIGADPMLSANIKQLGGLALRHHLALTANIDDVGVLISYYRDNDAMYRRAAAYADRILNGANPGDLSIEQPMKFILVVNLNTAKALGLTIPPSLLLRADEVIQ